MGHGGGELVRRAQALPLGLAVFRRNRVRHVAQVRRERVAALPQRIVDVLDAERAQLVAALADLRAGKRPAGGEDANAASGRVRIGARSVLCSCPSLNQNLSCTSAKRLYRLPSLSQGRCRAAFRRWYRRASGAGSTPIRKFHPRCSMSKLCFAGNLPDALVAPDVKGAV